MALHKNDQGAYIIDFFDKHGRPLKENRLLAENMHTSIELGKTSVAANEKIYSFVIRRNVYNSIDKTGEK